MVAIRLLWWSSLKNIAAWWWFILGCLQCVWDENGSLPQFLHLLLDFFFHSFPWLRIIVTESLAQCVICVSVFVSIDHLCNQMARKIVFRDLCAASSLKVLDDAKGSMFVCPFSHFEERMYIRFPVHSRFLLSILVMFALFSWCICGYMLFTVSMFCLFSISSVPPVFRCLE